MIKKYTHDGKMQYHCGSVYILKTLLISVVKGEYGHI